MADFLPNLRDIGGLPTLDGRVTRAGRVLRSALPLADDVVPAQVAWPPRSIIDLRSAEELQPQHPLVATGATVHHVPLLSALRPGVAPPEALAGLYLLMLQNTSDHLVNVVNVIAEEPGPVLVHCFAGKDRTGVSIALLLSLLGVDRAHVVADYMLTAQSEEQIEARFRRVRGPRRRQFPAEYFMTLEAAINAALDVWHGAPGGVAGWFAGAGGHDEVVDRLRRSLLE